MSKFQELVQEQFDEIITRFVTNKEFIYYGGEPYDPDHVSYLKVEGASPDAITNFIQKYDESGTFEGYLDCNGCDQDWGHDMTVKGVKFHIWGSVTSGSLCAQSPHPDNN
jgi:hypothetical protein